MLDSLSRIENIHVCFEGGPLGFTGHSLSVISQSSRWPGESGIRGFHHCMNSFWCKGRGHHSSQVTTQIQGRCWDLSPPSGRRGAWGRLSISPCFQMSVTASSGLSPVHFLFC